MTNNNLRPKSSKTQLSNISLAITNPVSLVGTGNLSVALAGYSEHTQRAYRGWIKRYLSEVLQLPPESLNLDTLEFTLALAALNVASLKAWLGSLKASGEHGGQGIRQAKSSVVWLAQHLADVGAAEYTLPWALSKIKPPRAEVGQCPGIWLSVVEIKRLLFVALADTSKTLTKRYRDAAVLFLLTMCGLRCEEVTEAVWSDIIKQGGNIVLRTHGKGEKMRMVKLPQPVIGVIEAWRDVCFFDTQSGPIFRPVKMTGQIIARKLNTRTVWKIVVEAGKAVGQPDLSPHDLRRSFARGAYEAGASFELIRQALGHSSITTTERYVNARIEFDRAATDIFADELRRADDID